MQVTLEPAWLESGWQMFLGVRASVTTEDCVKILTKPERLGMKIGSSDRVDTIFTKGQEGLRFTPCPRPPLDLRGLRGMLTVYEAESGDPGSRRSMRPSRKVSIFASGT